MRETLRTAEKQATNEQEGENRLACLEHRLVVYRQTLRWGADRGARAFPVRGRKKSRLPPAPHPPKKKEKTEEVTFTGGARARVQVTSPLRKGSTPPSLPWEFTPPLTRGISSRESAAAAVGAVEVQAPAVGEVVMDPTSTSRRGGWRRRGRRRQR